MGETMKRYAIWAIAGILAAAAGIPGSCLAGEHAPPAARNPIAALAGSAVPTADLGQQHARGTPTINLNTALTGGDGSAFEGGTVVGNSVSGLSNTGLITTTNSVNNNTGITTVFQNTGNNTLMQESMTINISLH
jgi:hypothetical protein